MPFSANPVGALTVDISFQWLLCLLACKLPKLSSEIFIVGCPVPAPATLSKLFPVNHPCLTQESV